MASNPPGACFVRGIKHEGTPVGETRTIGKTPAYVSVPQNGQRADKAILFLSDVFGIWNNSKLLADELAAQGYVTVLPDILSGDQLPLNVFQIDDFDIQGWGTRHGPDVVDPIVQEAIDYIHRILEIDKIAAVGYCFGGKYVARFLRPGQIDSGYTAHPSYITEEELAGIKGSFSIAAAEIDHIFTDELRHKSEGILKKTKQRWQINLFSGVEHGFATRADLSVPSNLFAKEQAFWQAVAWFASTL